MQQTNQLRILVVDDNPGDVGLISAMLSGSGLPAFELESAGRLAAALSLLECREFDVVLLDLGLPDSAGIETIEQFLESRARAALVVLTGLDDRDVALAAVQRGAEDYWTKSEMNERFVGRALTYAIERHRFRRDLAEANHKLMHAQKMDAIGRLAGGVAHDFNNLLMAISGNAELLLEDVDDSGARELVEEILIAGQRGAELTRRLLSVSRSEEEEPDIIDVAELVRQSARLVRRLLPTTIDVVVEVQDQDLRVRASASRLQQVVLNLALNARDAMPDGGELTLQAELDPKPNMDGQRAVVLAVADTGIGMSPAVAARVFEPFFTTKPDGEGTGLGLGIVYAIVQRAKGSIELETKVGAGSRFILRLPSKANAVTPLVRSTIDLPALRRGDEAVAVVDDDDAVRRFACQTLARCGYDVRGFSSGFELLHAVESQGYRPAACLLDIVMPKIDGVTTAHRLLALIHNVPVVFMTGHARPEQVARIAEEFHGAPLYKPLSMRKLASALRSALDSPPSTRTHNGPRHKEAV